VKCYIDNFVRLWSCIRNVNTRLQFKESTKLPINDYMRDDTLLKVSTTDPSYANIVNYIVAGYIPLWQTRKRLFEIADYTSRITHIYIRCVLMAY
jgi:hypothetical protein